MDLAAIPVDRNCPIEGVVVTVSGVLPVVQIAAAGMEWVMVGQLAVSQYPQFVYSIDRIYRVYLSDNCGSVYYPVYRGGRYNRKRQVEFS